MELNLRQTTQKNYKGGKKQTHARTQHGLQRIILQHLVLIVILRYNLLKMKSKLHFHPSAEKLPVPYSAVTLKGKTASQLGENIYYIHLHFSFSGG